MDMQLEHRNTSVYDLLSSLILIRIKLSVKRENYLSVDSFARQTKIIDRASPSLYDWQTNTWNK